MRRCLKHLSAAGLLLAGAALAGAPAVAEPSAEDLASPQSIQAGRAKFVSACAYCHGSEGDAGKNRPFRERIDWDATQIYQVIHDGRQRGANVMPAWNGTIPDEQIWQIVAYIKSLGGKPKLPS